MQDFFKILAEYLQNEPLRALSDDDLWTKFRTVNATEEGARAFAVLLERWGGEVFQVCQNRIKNKHNAEDVFQTAVLALIRKRESFSTFSKARYWLLRVSINQANESLRKLSIQRPSADPIEQWKADETAQINELLLIVQDGVMSLPRAQRDVVQLVIQQGLSVPVAAIKLDSTVKAVQKNLERGRATLQKLFRLVG
jgi:RNA polymerase sigma factor (sigma-70 family)